MYVKALAILLYPTCLMENIIVLRVHLVHDIPRSLFKVGGVCELRFGESACF